MAEQRTQEILWIIQPALVSEERRKSIIGYIQRLIKGYYDIEVFPFGSVPLKTFLPDGDIDLTALSCPNVEEALARDICSILGNEQDSEFEVQDVQYIRAQVKVVKCTVDNIPVDISFNQTAGLSALCFLEQVDRIVGKDHLFKRSIILIKAWCYYESRILGAHHGLISTYALETLILYIINIFHSSLCGPLVVLYKFLDYYSTFDWENYCVSINGPISISSPSAVFAESPEIDADELLLSQDFLRYCREIFSIPMQSTEIGTHVFPIKHFNIVDPLKENNNLGRSVSKGNFHRIRCALSYGAQRLGEILMLPGENMGMGLEKFFINTLERNGKGQRPDVQVPLPAFGTGRSEESDLSGDYDGYYNALIYSQWYHSNVLSVPVQLSAASPSSHTPKKSAWDALRRFVRGKRNIFYRRGTNVFIPRLPISHPCALQLPAATSGIDKMTKSRGTGTYIPDTAHLCYREKQSWVNTRNPESSTRGLLQYVPKNTNPIETDSWVSARNPESTTHGLSQNSPKKTNPTENFQETNSWVSTGIPESTTHGLLQNSPEETIHIENSLQTESWVSTRDHKSANRGLLQNSLRKANPIQSSLETDQSEDGSCLDLDLSPEQFPCLPCTKRTTTTHQSSQPMVKCTHTENCSRSLPGIRFGEYECSLPIGMHSPPEPKDSSLSMPTIGKHKQEELCELNEERDIVKPFQLTDNDDFPPLWSM
ncbi:hypothetical protein CCACVL1_22365 [Corchorus capsularis]|uniref:PAP/25A-associated n=1 Tax=Corchorus capsularis TaxID=210143 RepID=A0A1R3H083_COCAP|nr:hypothetical protein CCACVL1_22365 [Corchorus capsularis]